ncbi:cathepsin O-like [Ischnura elegans]|uniref:cathepsin O-like n=1 Tax=Ischnura elegans TaxID=197161 RepID=UPI001ED88919|nr:cathepsin O-like [Ischnura elegans]
MEWKNALATIGLVLLCFFGIPLHLDTNTQNDTTELFDDFIKKFNKSYVNNTAEYKHRLSMFKESLKRIEEMNKLKPHNSSATYGLTKFSDMSPDEFLQVHLQPGLNNRVLMQKLLSPKHNTHTSKKRVVKRAVLPDKVDWRDKKIVTPVKNQKNCGACWAFSTVETTESMYALKTGKLESLSVQQVIDCAGNGNKGCDGGDTCSVLEWMKSQGIHLNPEKSYPLTWVNGVCPLKSPSSGVQIADYACYMFTDQEDLMLTLLAEHGPLVAAVNAINWQNYVSGTIQFHCEGGPASVNHAVQIVGYDKTAVVPHYIVRNSWGLDFGDKGYLYVAIGGDICGITTEVSAVDVV